MDKNSIIGFVLIFLIMLGFFGYQGRQVQKQQAIQAQLDSIAAAEALADTVTYIPSVKEEETVKVYSDSLLNAAANADAQLVTLSNDKLEVTFTTRGAQPYSVMVKDYLTYGKEPIYLLQGGKSELGYIVYAPTAVDTRKFNFQVVQTTDTTVVMRLPFALGGYIEQTYTLLPDSYSVNEQ
ncbi:MAG: YidC/Oxa1 family insertase periplasmic-domain containing protein, partial [Bacteroidales bacterium]|nr:YidC/Oxa1 family insertase periplasmic-domain containing protein [Bacteroidales bacterium]